MDLEMPMQNGYEVLKNLNAFLNSVDQTTIIFAATGHSDEAERRKCVEHGFHEYITKPIVRETLVQILVRWLFD